LTGLTLPHQAAALIQGCPKYPKMCSTRTQDSCKINYIKIQHEINLSLDWQFSQFINIVGKDDFIQKGINFTGRGCVKCSKSGFRWVRPSQTCSPPSPHSPREISEFPPTHPRIVAAVSWGKDLVRASICCHFLQPLPPFPFCTPASSLLVVVYCQQTRFVPIPLSSHACVSLAY
jgi:hypothetical protein